MTRHQRHQLVTTPESDWRVRRFHWGDLETVLEIESQAHEDPWPRDYFLRWLKNTHVFGVVGESNQELRAYMICALENDGFHILNLAVNKGFRRMGYGRRMLESAAELAREYEFDRIFLEVDGRNWAAQRLYLKCGFVAETRLARYFRGEDGYRMVRHLDDPRHRFRS